MPFYENTIIARHNLATQDLKNIKEKYHKIIGQTDGKVVKVEEWGLLNLAKKINNYKKGFFIHYKFEGNRKTIDEFSKKLKLDKEIIRHLIVKYKKLDLDNEYFESKSE